MRSVIIIGHRHVFIVSMRNTVINELPICEHFRQNFGGRQELCLYTNLSKNTWRVINLCCHGKNLQSIATILSYNKHVAYVNDTFKWHICPYHDFDIENSYLLYRNSFLVRLVQGWAATDYNLFKYLNWSKMWSKQWVNNSERSGPNNEWTTLEIWLAMSEQLLKIWLAMRKQHLKMWASQSVNNS